MTLIVQLPPAATELPQLLVWAKSLALVPVIARLVMVNGGGAGVGEGDGLSRTGGAHRLAAESETAGGNAGRRCCARPGEAHGLGAAAGIVGDAQRGRHGCRWRMA